MFLTPKGVESTALRCPYCKRPMSKLTENSKFWHCECCNSDFEESPFLNKF